VKWHGMMRGTSLTPYQEVAIWRRRFWCAIALVALEALLLFLAVASNSR
jgi:hypothetical protein